MNEGFWYLLLLFVLADFTIISEQPRWVFALEKRLRPTDDNGPLRFYGTRLQTIIGGLLLLLFFIRSSALLAIMMGLLWLSALRGLVKVINLLPTRRQQAGYLPFEILDFYHFFQQRNRCFLQIKAANPQLGTRILPMVSCVPLRRSQRVWLHYRQGALGLLYRFPWDPVF
jgi:hypothetical protein